MAAQEPPAESAPADGATPAQPTNPGDEARSQALGAFPPANERSPSFRQFTQFDKSRAGQIFQPPASVAAARQPDEPAPAPAPTGTDAAAPQPTAPASNDPQPESTVAEPEKDTPSKESGDTKAAKEYTAKLDVDGSPVIATAGTQIPADNPLFTVESVTADKTVLKLNSGSFADGDTITIAKGASVTLSNPASGATVVIRVVDIAKAATTK